MLKRCVYGKVGFWDFIVGRAIILEVCRGKTVRFFSQVNDQIVTVELPEALVKEYWEKTPDFQTFVEEFRVRNPLAKDLQKKAPPAAKAAAATKSVLPRKRPATKDVSGVHGRPVRRARFSQARGGADHQSSMPGWPPRVIPCPSLSSQMPVRTSSTTPAPQLLGCTIKDKLCASLFTPTDPGDTGIR